MSEAVDPTLPGVAPARLSGRATSTTGQRSRALACCILLASIVLLATRLESTPGVHADEAWSLLQAMKILAGARPLDGMNYYTGALQQYVLAAGLWLFGPQIGVARAIAVAANVGMLAEYMWLVRRLHPDGHHWLWVGALTMASATFVAESRFATEITTLTPLLFFSGLLLIQQALASEGRWGRAFAGGSLWGLAIYNHMAAAPMIVGAILGYSICAGANALLDVRAHAALAGAFAGLTPRIVQIAGLPPGDFEPRQRLLGALSVEALTDLSYLPGVLRGMWDGDLIYERFCGEPLVFVVPAFSVSGLVLLALRLLRQRRLPGRRDLAIVAAISTAAALATLIAPGLALRYFIVPVLALPYLLVRLALRDAPEGTASVPRWERAIGVGALSAVVGLQCCYVVVDYSYAYSKSGGQLHVFWLGKRLLESSNGFIRTDVLYAELAEKAIAHVIAADAIGWPLQYHNLSGARLRSISDGEVGGRFAEDGPTALVYYNGPAAVAGRFIEDLRGVGSLDIDGRAFVLDPSFDSHFRVYVHRPKPVRPSGSLSVDRSALARPSSAR